jgi:hypothetical protein
LSNRKQVAWRRNKTEELLVKGHNQIQIADILQVSEATISNDVGYLRARARQDMETHLYDRLPQEYEHCISGINQILKMSWEIATRDYQGSDSANNTNSSSNSYKTLSSKVDDKTRLQALALANDCYKYKIDLVTNGVVVSDAVKFVQQKKEELHKINDDKTGAANLNSSEYPTTNKVF